MKKFLGCLLLVSVGCGIYPNIDSCKIPVGAVSPQSELSSKVQSALNSADKNDCILIYSQLKGMSEYIKITSRTKTTGELFSLLTKVQEDLGWTREKYIKFTDLIESELKARGFADNKKIDNDVRANLVNFFDEVSNSVRLIIINKQ